MINKNEDTDHVVCDKTYVKAVGQRRYEVQLMTWGDFEFLKILNFVSGS